MKRLLAVVAGALGLRALLRRRRPGVEPAHVDDLRSKLAASRDLEADRAVFEAGETPVDEATAVDERRADVHARARRAMDDLQN